MAGGALCEKGFKIFIDEDFALLLDPVNLIFNIMVDQEKRALRLGISTAQSLVRLTRLCAVCFVHVLITVKKILELQCSP
ncbi:hypothetical protein [Desulfitobacterium hafniense]|uniref:hypothetical protein n=1 Tax=Desulfitobacterium hafniense TaxID=49338 RepID=UPI000362D974|nr:hypothetical protein [Desulfitobacterium hafniense]